MDKIKVNNIFAKIRSTVFGTPLASARLRLNIAKNIFIFTAFLYFFSVLMTVGGFFLGVTSVLVFFLYPIFVFSFLALVYGLIVYTLTVYAESYLSLRYGVFALLLVIFIVIIALHLGAYSFILSFLWKN
ncbi:MAG: hypothetical protein ACD_71C00061G0003 [uncultured bacterium (gcode 4)]|uniref:Uncharacterized protein n=1 Tax=uncultured bacterium (gcode 4) TaxID=1234023 RepID=K1YP16_9BACT|nr:MAG: hypothetical protein ACD_71C00061G0003 [uncultured bacterium (gcode 4)]